MSTLFSLSLLFYLLFDAPGSIPVFVSLLKDYSPGKQQRIILRESIFALVTLILFITFGRKIFHFLGVSLYAFQLIGGVLLLSVSLKMMFVSPFPETQEKLPKDHSEPIFFPLAFPIITGPAVITSLLTYMEEGVFTKEIILISVVIAWACSVLTLMSSSVFNRILGRAGLFALEKLFSIALLLMAVNLMLKSMSIAFNIGFYVKI